MHWWLSIPILLYAAGLHAQQARPEVPDEADAAPVDLEFIEYLGTLVFTGEAWVGPEDMVVPVEAEVGVEEAEGTEGANGAEGGPTERRVQYEDAFERDLQTEPGDAG